MTNKPTPMVLPSNADASDGWEARHEGRRSKGRPQNNKMRAQYKGCPESKKCRMKYCQYPRKRSAEIEKFLNLDTERYKRIDEVLYVRCLQDLTKGVNSKNPNYWYFCTDGVFWNSCQSEVYETVTSGLYDELLDGVRAIILCYGQTGTGKTFTISGLRFSFENRGLIIRILSQLFDEEEARRDVTKISLGMSYLEFNGQNIKDLISNKNLNSIKEIIEYPITNEVWAWKQLFNAETRKSYSESAPYIGSNRGHSVLTFYIHGESLIDTDPVIRHSKIHIVDMGGIDNFGSKPSEWKDKVDVSNSNTSKSLMEQLILCLTGAVWKNENHVCPYKSSRFLTYLHDTLKQKCLLRFIAHIYGNFENLPLTISTLKFGEKIRALKPIKLERIYQSNRELEIRNLEREYLRLKDEAELIGMLRDSPYYSNISQERLQEIKRAAEAFLFGQLENLTLFSLGQASLTLEVFRDLYQRLSAEKEQIIRDAIMTATEMMQTQMTVERNLVSNVSMTPVTQKMSKRRSRQMESQVSFGVSYRSSDSMHNIGKVSSIVQQAGVTDKKGIGIGPGKSASTFEGNITKAYKKLKSKKSDSIIMKGVKSTTTKEFGTLSSKNQILEDNFELSMPQGIPSRDLAWQHFFNEKTDLVNELQNEIEKTEEIAREAKRKYMRTLAELAKIREQVEESKSELENCHHIRQIYGKKEFCEEGNVVSGEYERYLLQVIAQKGDLVNATVENCHLALVDFRSAVEELNEAKKALEEAFQDYCKEHYKLVFVPDELTSSEIKSEESGKGMLSEADLKNQAREELYAKLQEKLLNHVSKSPKNSRKEWVKLF